MKGFWIALLLLLALTLSIFWAAHKVDGVLGALTEELLRKNLSEVDRLWEQNRRLLRLTLHQGEMIQIEERLAALKSAASLGDESASEIERARLLCSLRRARDTVSPSLSDIF